MSIITCPVCFLDLAEAPPAGSSPRADKHPVSDPNDWGRGRPRTRLTRGRAQIANRVTEPQSGRRNRAEIVTTQCGHIFHHVCALEWFLTQKRRRTCPTCKRHCPDWNKLLTLYPHLEPVQNALTDNLAAVTAELNDCKVKLVDAQKTPWSTIVGVVRRGLKRDSVAAQLDADTHEEGVGEEGDANVPAADPVRINVQQDTSSCIVM